VLVEKRGSLLQTVRLDPSGRQFDRERHSIQFSADVCDDGRLRIADFQTGAARHRALHEQLGCGELLKSCCCEPWNVRRIGKRIQPVDVLTLNPERLSAGGQDMGLRCGVDDACHKPSDRFHEVFARIQDQQDSLVLQKRNEVWRHVVRLDRDPEHGGNTGCCEL
jgi:hypothetical protein